MKAQYAFWLSLVSSILNSMNRLRYFSLFFLIMVTTITAQTDNCGCCSEDHKAFDFWIGEWEVFQSDGSQVGINVITKEQDSCILRENWTSSNGTFTGSSTNFYNKQANQWEQLWIDNTGSHLHLKGHRTGNQMILLSDQIAREDKPPYVNRITWTLNEDGTVRQLWDVLVAQEVESVVFDGIYRKKE